MKNFIQQGNTLDLTAPAGGLMSGQGHLFGSLFGVAATDIPAGTRGAVSVVGVYSLPKETGVALTEGEAVYWDGDKITATAAGNAPVGHVIDAAAGASTTATVRISS